MHRAHASLLLMLFVTSFSLYAKEEALPTMQELINNNKITLTSWLSSENTNLDKKRPIIIAINQPVILTIDIATPRWFTDGTVIETISIPNLIAQQHNLQATNYSQMEGEQTWSHQRWEIPLFAQQSGQFVVPSIGIKITVSVATGKNVHGVLFTSPHRFSVQRPTAKMTHPEEWIIAPEVTLTQDWQASTTQKTNVDIGASTLTVGDAITRTITLKVTDSLAMLLPPLLPAIQNKAILRYTDPIQLKDINNRGEHTAQKKESETYVLQTGGEVTLPSITIPFWNTMTQQSEKLILEGKTIRVKHTLSSWLIAYWKILVLITLITITCFGFIKKITHYYKSHPYPDWFVFLQSIKSHSYPQIRLYLYRRLFNKTDLLELKKYQTNNQKKWLKNSETLQQSTLPPRKLWQLWFKIKK
ncbi:BatD family protein [Aliivibrio sifiae]|uniref:BatD family protein n=1 Tax=Aliivibrio sifiae TaxID=566293 RepID=UPI003D13920B